MGETYLLTSIAVVVIGGTSVAGGFSNVPGLWGAALFLFLLADDAQHVRLRRGSARYLDRRHRHPRHRRRQLPQAAGVGSRVR